MHRSTPTTNSSDVDRSHLPDMAQRQRARLITLRTQDRNLLSGLNRCGAEEARGAHNPEVIGSNPIAGIFTSQFYRNCHAVYTATHTRRCSSVEERLNPDLRHLRPAMVRQRVGYPLITGRTLDRNQPPAINFFFTGVNPVRPPSLLHRGLRPP